MHFNAIAALMIMWAGLYPTGGNPAQVNMIHVEIGGLHNDKGNVVCDLYSSSDGFAKDSWKALLRATSVISNGKGVCEFSGIKLGTYAVSVFHDQNSNGKLDTNFLNVPREGVGASNDARGHLGLKVSVWEAFLA